jgi:peptidyl-prolyl cis-trans isomerase C
MKPIRPPISVNGSLITAERIAAEAQHHPAPPRKPGLAWRAAAMALTMRELLLQEARRRGLAPVPVEVAPGLLETDEEALVRQLLEATITPVEPDESKLRRAYERDPDRFRAPTLYEAAHILFPAPPGDAEARAAARQRAETVLEVLRGQPGRFAELARQHSACASRDSGGLLGQVSAGDTVPEFEAVLEQLDEGRIAPKPVETRYGFHIVRLDARARGAVLPFETVAPRLRAAYEKAAWLRAARDFSAALAREAEVSGIDLEAA